jgi:hypothetical protein
MSLPFFVLPLHFPGNEVRLLITVLGELELLPGSATGRNFHIRKACCSLLKSQEPGCTKSAWILSIALSLYFLSPFANVNSSSAIFYFL